MSFYTMRKDLIKQGLIDERGKLTQKGHEYVETTKQELKTKTQQAGEEIERATREAESILSSDDQPLGGTIRGRSVRYADVDGG